MCEQLTEDIRALLSSAGGLRVCRCGVVAYHLTGASCERCCRHFVQEVIGCFAFVFEWANTVLFRPIPQFVGRRPWVALIAKARSHLVRNEFVRSDDQRYRSEPSDMASPFPLTRQFTGHEGVQGLLKTSSPKEND